MIPGEFWRLLGTPMDSRELFGALGNSMVLLRDPQDSWGLVETPWDSLVLFGTPWESLGLQGTLGDSLDFLETP